MGVNASLDEIHATMKDHVETLRAREATWTRAGDVTAAGRIVDVPALARLDDRAFIEAAYRGVLGREVDPSAMAHHLALLARGTEKVVIVRSLSETPEGRAFGARLVGAWPEGRLRRLYRVPVVGRATRLAVSVLRTGQTRTHVQTLHDHAMQMQDEDRLREARTEAQFQELRQQADDLRAIVLSLVRRIADTASHEQVVAVRRGLEALSREHDQSRRTIAGLKDEVEREAWADPILTLAERLDRVEARTGDLHASLNEAQRLETVIDQLATAFRNVRTSDGQIQQDGIRAIAQAADVLTEQAHRLRDAERATEVLATSLQDQERRLGLLLETVRRRAEPLDESQQAVVATQQDHLLDSLYVAFEDRFRGSRQLIKERQRVHLDLMREAGAGRSDRPVIDVGAGRGEWLELLAEEGLSAQGIDLNEAMVEACRAQGLDCVSGDAVEILSRIPAGTIGAVTGFHIIEHLPFRVMVALFDETLRVLAPGGVALFETPNPANLLVSSRFFHLDPTHRNPLPGEMVAMIAEARGFGQVRILPLHPMSETFMAQDVELGRKLDAVFHGPQDYALIARKA